MKLLFLGDSITCANRFFSNNPSGLGDGYVACLDQMLKASSNSSFWEFTLTNKGFDGLTAAALYERLCDGRISISGYDHIFLLIGVNEVGIAMNTGVSLSNQHFTDTFASLINDLRAQTRGVTVLSPFLFPEPAEYIGWLPALNECITDVQNYCTGHNIPYYNIQDFLQAQMRQYATGSLSEDGVHLTESGHRLLAEYLLEHVLPSLPA